MPLVLYSTNAYVAYMINERYYNGLHYVWCSEVFDARRQYAYGPHANIPPSASPWEVYRAMREEVRRGDLHSANFERLRKTLADGATAKLEAKLITEARYDDVSKTLDQALLSDFRPVLYIIPFAGVANLVQEVPIGERAHPLSVEVRIPALPRTLFDIIEVNYE